MKREDSCAFSFQCVQIDMGLIKYLTLPLMIDPLQENQGNARKGKSFIDIDYASAWQNLTVMYAREKF